MTNKGCEVNYSFENRFILSEDHLQTISSMIKERYPEENLIYEITKNNVYVFQTSNIIEIFNEENSNANLITKLDIIINNAEINFILSFQKGEKPFFKISENNKDRVFLLYNDIKTYVEKEVIRKKVLRVDLELLFTMLSASIALLLILIPMLGNNKEIYNETINSSDILVKLNYLIMEKETILITPIYSIYNIIIFGCILLSFITIIFYYLKKENYIKVADYFLFGKQKDIYARKVDRKNKIIWTIGIGSLVSILAGLIVYFITK